MFHEGRTIKENSGITNECGPTAQFSKRPVNYSLSVYGPHVLVSVRYFI